MDFSQKILAWYAENKRELPWRKTKDPYKIWLSEVILQQTRIAQGTPYYERFVDEFPTVFELANAPEQKVLKLWQGLGYYSRARNMHASAKLIVEQFRGNFPNTYIELVKLKGVGDYTASAIASICFGELQPVVDGNVYRVLSRYFGVGIPINSSEGIKYFKTLAREVMSKEDICDYNQGIMEFGAIQCVPKNPKCSECTLQSSCKALESSMVAELPVKLKKTKIKHRHFNYLVPIDKNGNTLFRKRTQRGIWQNLFEFPLLETKEQVQTLDEETILQQVDLGQITKITLYNKIPVVHKLSHQHLHTKFWVIETNSILKNGVTVENLSVYPTAVLIDNFIRTFKF